VTINNPETIESVKTFASTTAPKYDATYTASGNEFTSFNQVNSIAIQGGSTSTESVLGLTMLATSLQEAASTASSTSGAPLVLLSRYADATYDGSKSNQIVVTGSTNLIDANYIATTSPYAWTASHSFSASTTLSGATTTIGYLSITNDDILANGLSLRLPSQITASSTSLMADANGKLIFDTPQTPELLTTTTATGSVTTIGASGLANRSHYTIILSTRGKTTSNAMELRFNGDQGNNYNYRNYEDYKLTGNSRNAGQISPENVGTTTPQFFKMEITNVSSLGKQIYWNGNASTTILTGAGEWTNSTNALSAIQFHGGGGSFLINSKLWIYASRD